jgi:hypothetical protein
MSSLKIRLTKKQTASIDDNIDIRCFLRPIAVATLVKEQSSCDGQVVDVTHVNDIAEQICSNCKQREVVNEVKKCGFSDWCAECDASLWATNPDVICTGVTCGSSADVTLNVKSNVPLSVPQTVTHKRNLVIESDDDVAGSVVQIKRKKQIKDESSVSDCITSI